MAFTDDDRERMVETATKVEEMHSAMYHEGLARCATHQTKLESIEKTADSSKAWTKAVAIAVIGPVLLFVVNMATSLFKAVASLTP